ncbi:unnamed protein product [Moneuplotes crassus]|uniref:Uncharacterized protein n=1 Tax=Euplotes crassus TaxID=5936 RepID=A0AAD1Y2V4_EUPCR|nr:unnamed protein product [Moneuplotes crassus]
MKTSRKHSGRLNTASKTKRSLKNRFSRRSDNPQTNVLLIDSDLNEKLNKIRKKKARTFGLNTSARNWTSDSGKHRRAKAIHYSNKKILDLSHEKSAKNISGIDFLQRRIPKTAVSRKRNKIKNNFFTNELKADKNSLESTLSFSTRECNKEDNKSISKFEILKSSQRKKKDINVNLEERLRSEMRNLSETAYNLSLTFSESDNSKLAKIYKDKSSLYNSKYLNPKTPITLSSKGVTSPSNKIFQGPESGGRRRRTIISQSLRLKMLVDETIMDEDKYEKLQKEIKEIRRAKRNSIGNGISQIFNTV